MGEGQKGETGSHRKEAAENECDRKSQDGCRCKEALGQSKGSRKEQAVSGLRRKSRRFPVRVQFRPSPPHNLLCLRGVAWG